MNSKTSVVAKQCRLETWARQIQGKRQITRLGKDPFLVHT